MKDRKRGTSNRRVAGFAWYRAEQWDRFREIVSDPDSIESNYEDWLSSAETWLSTITKSGVRAVKVDVDVEELLQWCRDQGRPVDGEARSAFAAYKASRLEEGRG